MKILCICHANICRSFMAQEFLKKFLPGATVFSRGFYADAAYQVPDKVKKALKTHQITYVQHISTQLSAQDLEQADLIFCMERAHEERLLDRYAQYTQKIWLLSEFALGKTEDLEDPISLPERAFAKQANHLYDLCQKAATQIAQTLMTQK